MPARKRGRERRKAAALVGAGSTATPPAPPPYEPDHELIGHIEEGQSPALERVGVRPSPEWLAGQANRPGPIGWLARLASMGPLDLAVPEVRAALRLAGETERVEAQQLQETMCCPGCGEVVIGQAVAVKIHRGPDDRRVWHVSCWRAALPKPGDHDGAWSFRLPSGGRRAG